jgi:Sap, sulfolipid-1-addressing protein
VLLHAAGLALLAALSPTALLIAAVYLGSERPRLTAGVYLIGAVVMSLVMAVLILVVLRNAHLSHPGAHTPRYGLRLGLGVLLLAVGAVTAWRKPSSPDPAKPQKGLMSKMVAKPAPTSAFAAGVLVFAPGATFIAALQVIATARASLQLTVVALTVVVAINVLLVWLPIVFYLAVPGVTTRRLAAFNGWLRAHGAALLACVLIVAGAIMLGNGLYGLV